MKIAIDATILRSQNTGTGFYVINLLNGLMKYDKENEYIVFGNKEIIKKFVFLNNKNFRIENVIFKNRIVRVLWQLFILPFKLKKLNVNILHSTNYITPLFKFNLKFIVTIHDLTFIIFPEKFTIVKRLFFRFMVPIFIRRADKVITVSENTKNDIIKFLKVPKEKISVTFETYNECYDSEIKKEDSKKILDKYGINKNYFLFVGMIEPRKNILSILKAFIELDDELDEDLVIVGKKGWYYREIEEFMENIKNKRLKNRIIFTGFVSEKELVSIYKNAEIFIYPSFYEGFGIPPLEAMVCGVPVITSNTSSIPEVVGDAAIKIDPYNYIELKEAIKVLKHNPQKKEEMSEKGKEQSKKFSSKKFAENTINIYKKAVS